MSTDDYGGQLVMTPASDACVLWQHTYQCHIHCHTGSSKVLAPPDDDRTAADTLYNLQL